MKPKRRDIPGISGWALIAPLMAGMPSEILDKFGKCESPIEQLFACALGLVILSLAEPERPSIEVQVPIGNYRADIVIVGPKGAPRLVIECDGSAFHTNIKRDTNRTAAIETAGYRVLRVTGSEIHHNPLARAKILMKEVGFMDISKTMLNAKRWSAEDYLSAG